MTERTITLTPSQLLALPAAYQRLQQLQGQLQQVQTQYVAICQEIGIDPQGHYELRGDQLVVPEPPDVMTLAEQIAQEAR